MPAVQTSRISIYFEEAGCGEPLLLIRGLGGSCESMRSLADLLARRFRVISFDNRCVGRSDQPQQPFTIADMADDTAALLDALGVESAHVFGTSLGGMVAQELALRRPQRVRRLALGCTHAGVRNAVRAPDWAVQVFNDSSKQRRNEAVRSSVPILFARKTVEERPELVEETLRVMVNNRQPLSSYMLQLGAALKHDTWDRLPQIKHPTLVLTGTEDMLIASANSARLVERIPGARLIEFEQTGHLFFSEEPEKVSGVLESFFSESS